MAQRGLRETLMWVNIQRLTGVAHCANVVWPDLEEEGVHFSETLLFSRDWLANGKAEAQCLSQY